MYFSGKTTETALDGVCIYAMTTAYVRQHASITVYCTFIICINGMLARIGTKLINRIQLNATSSNDYHCTLLKHADRKDCCRKQVCEIEPGKDTFGKVAYSDNIVQNRNVIFRKNIHKSASIPIIVLARRRNNSLCLLKQPTNANWKMKPAYIILPRK